MFIRKEEKVSWQVEMLDWMVDATRALHVRRSPLVLLQLEFPLQPQKGILELSALSSTSLDESRGVT